MLISTQLVYHDHMLISITPTCTLCIAQGSGQGLHFYICQNLVVSQRPSSPQQVVQVVLVVLVLVVFNTKLQPWILLHIFVNAELLVRKASDQLWSMSEIRPGLTLTSLVPRTNKRPRATCN